MRMRNVSRISSPVRLFEISANDVHQLFRRFTRVFPILGFEHMVAQMAFDQLCHQSVHASARSGNQLQDFGAIRPVVEGAFHGIHLSANSLHPGNQLLLVFRGVPHAKKYYTVVGMYGLCNRMVGGISRPNIRRANFLGYNLAQC
ncbi:MAG: hypothetical protein QOH35_3047 [Acidobacteriaceae bacterium]|jgi:hypothetical protein|nr:hypothetical protein [Acidobacteriaceae bacterium]